ncbi:hypothetical protein ACPCG0_13345 [Propionibacteriaceae bacterium Y1923]
MTAFTLDVGDDTLTINGAPETQHEATLVLSVLAEVREQWATGFTIEVGSWVYMTEQREVAGDGRRGQWQVLAFQLGQVSWTDDASVALVSLHTQAAVVARTGLASQQCRVDHYVLVHTDLMPRAGRGQPTVYLHRTTAPQEQADGSVASGWFLSPFPPQGSPEPDQLRLIPAGALLDEYSFLVPALLLPQGTVVIFDETGIQKVLDEGGTNRW